MLNGSKKNPAMAAWKGQLSDVELAAVITYERNAFGNTMGDMVQPKADRRGSQVTPRNDSTQREAGEQRAHTAPTRRRCRAHADHPTGILRWLTSTNHKDIGTLYLFFSFTMFIVGGIMALTIRAELFQPGLQIVQPELFNQLTTLHGLIMLFGAFMPAFVGFANWQIPLMIGAPDMAFPRLNNFSFWLLPPAAILLVGSFFAPGGATGCRLDALPAAVGADGAGHGHGHLRHPHPGRVVDHRLDQHHRRRSSTCARRA